MTHPPQPDPQLDPELTPGHVADLQKQLSDAAAQVAKVQAELHAATGGAAGSVEPPHHDPIVFLGGQQFGSGTGQVDLASMIGADRAAQVQQALARFGSMPQLASWGSALPAGSGLQGLLGSLGAASAPPATPATVARLADPPRPVPFPYLMATLSWRGWEMFTILMIVVAPIALWGLEPVTIPAGLILLFGVLVALRVRRDRLQLGLVRWGKVATVTKAEVSSVGSYTGGVSYQNVVLAQAHGWTVERHFYSGPGTATEIGYSVDDHDGTFTLHGLGYAGGVVLANSRKPDQALCVSSFPYDLEPDATGAFAGTLHVKTWLGIAATTVVYAAILAGAVTSTYEIWILGNGR